MYQEAFAYYGGNEMEHPQYVYCLGKRFLSQWSEAELRAELDSYKQALQQIALGQSSSALTARQALVNVDNANLTED